MMTVLDLFGLKIAFEKVGLPKGTSMAQFKTLSLIFGLSAVMLTTACSKLTFTGQDVACKAPDSAVKNGVNDGPVILYPTIDTVVSGVVAVTGTCVSGKTVEIKEGMEGTPVETACTNGSFATNFTLSSGDGSKDLVVSQKTAADGSDVVDRLCFQKDSVPPAVTITDGNGAQSTNTTSTVVQGTCETGLPVLIWGGGIITPISTSCENGHFSAVVTTSNSDGTKDITAGQVDQAGNQGVASTDINIDRTPPVVQITSPVPAFTNQSVLPVTGICETGLPVQIGQFRAETAPAVQCVNGTFSANIPLPGADGPVVANVYQVDLAGNFGQDTKNLIKDTVAPAITIASPLANTYLPANATFSGACETGINVVLGGSVLSAAKTVACTSGAWTLTTAITSGQGAKTLTASQTDAAGNVGTTQQTYMVDTIAPVLAFTSPAANTYVDSSFTVTGTCEAGLMVQLSGGGILPSTSTACAATGTFSTMVTTSPLDGSKEVIAAQTDAAGNTGSTSRTFLRDTLPPKLTIASPADGTIVNTSVTLTGACEAGLTIGFTGAGITASSVVCSSGGTYSITLTLSAGDGNKAVSAREVDAAGNASTANGTYLRDSTAPVVVITSPAAGTTGQTGLNIGGTCETGLNVTLAGSGVATAVVTPCTSGAFAASVTFTSGSGNKQVTATQTDLAGNVGSDSKTYVSDTTPPSVTITSPAANTYLPTTFTVQGACENSLNVVVAGAGLASSVTVSCASGAYSANVTVSSGDGSKLVTATQTDAAGNAATASKTYLRDTTAPVLTITSPANGTTGRTGVTIVGTCETGLTVNFSGSGLSGTSSATCVSGGYTANLTFSDGDGAKSVVVTETDGAGNSSQVTGNYNKDATPPAVAITAPAAGTVAQNGLNVSGTCEAGLNVTLSGSGVANPVIVACTSSGVFAGDIVFSAGDGAKAVTATQTDAVGNVGTSSRSFTKDTTAPAITITSPAANSYVGDSFTVQGACETGFNVTVAGAGVSSPVTVSCTSSAYSAVVSTSSGDGTKVVTASETDAAGNTGTATRNFLRDTAAPVITITDPTPNSAVAISVNLKGTCETGLTVYLTGDISSTSGACTSGAFNINITFTAGLGTKNVTAKQTDAAGNVGQATAAYSRVSDGASETFVSDASFGKIDVLFIDDNSASMDPKQASLGTKFSGFATEMKSIDWQIGITTTDCSTGPYGICGSLLTLTGYNSKILSPSVPNYQTVFNNSIQRPETAGCLNTGTCPSGNSEPLLSATTAMNKYNSDNNGFFRDNADLAIVILSDADERQTGGTAYQDRPAQLVAAFNNNWPSSTGKKLKVYSIIVQPGDSTCLDLMRAGSGGYSFYGTLIDQTVNLTGGLSTSICASDYSVTLQSIGQSVRTLTNSVELAHTPIAGSVTVTFTPSQTIGFTVIGNKVVFDAPPSVGTQIKVDYQY